MGFVTGCCKIKDTKRFAFGNVKVDDMSKIIGSRDEMKRKLHSKIIPDACTNCDSAKLISFKVPTEIKKMVAKILGLA